MNEDRMVDLIFLAYEEAHRIRLAKAEKLKEEEKDEFFTPTS